VRQRDLVRAASAFLASLIALVGGSLPARADGGVDLDLAARRRAGVAVAANEDLRHAAVLAALPGDREVAGVVRADRRHLLAAGRGLVDLDSPPPTFNAVIDVYGYFQ
jgi:hypothetical protein